MRLTTDALVGKAHGFIPWVLGLLVFAGVWWSAEGGLGVPSDLTTPVVVGLALASGLAAATARVRPWPIFVLATVTWIAMVAWPAPIVASYYAGTSLKRRRLAAYLAGSVVVMAVAVGVGAAVGGLRHLSTATPTNAVALAAWVLGFH